MSYSCSSKTRHSDKSTIDTHKIITLAKILQLPYLDEIFCLLLTFTKHSDINCLSSCSKSKNGMSQVQTIWSIIINQGRRLNTTHWNFETASAICDNLIKLFYILLVSSKTVKYFGLFLSVWFVCFYLGVCFCHSVWNHFHAVIKVHWYWVR